MGCSFVGFEILVGLSRRLSWWWHVWTSSIPVRTGNAMSSAVGNCIEVLSEHLASSHRETFELSLVTSHQSSQAKLGSRISGCNSPLLQCADSNDQRAGAVSTSHSLYTLTQCNSQSKWGSTSRMLPLLWMVLSSIPQCTILDEY